MQEAAISIRRAYVRINTARVYHLIESVETRWQRGDFRDITAEQGGDMVKLARPHQPAPTCRMLIHCFSRGSSKRSAQGLSLNRPSNCLLDDGLIA